MPVILALRKLRPKNCLVLKVILCDVVNYQTPYATEEDSVVEGKCDILE